MPPTIRAAPYARGTMTGTARLEMSTTVPAKRCMCAMLRCPMVVHVARIIADPSTNIDNPLRIMQAIITKYQMMYLYKQIGDIIKNARPIIRGQARIPRECHYYQIVMYHAWALSFLHQYSGW